MALSQYNSMAPFNCDPKIGVTERCPECGYFHLRPGYCWALDTVNNPNRKPTIPVNKPAVVNTPVNKDVNKVESLVNKPEPVIEPEEEVLDAEEKRKRYMREYMRRKRGK